MVLGVPVTSYIASELSYEMGMLFLVVEAVFVVLRMRAAEPEKLTSLQPEPRVKKQAGNWRMYSTTSWAFWNTENITVYDSTLNGEYLGWHSKHLG